MPRVSGYKKLPVEVRELIGSLREQGRTLDEILDALRALDISVPRTTLGNWTKKIDAVAAKVEQSRLMADALVRRFGDKEESKTARLNMQMMHTALFKVFEQTLEGSNNFTPQEAMQLAKALDHITRAAKTDAEFISRVRGEAREKALAEMKDKLDAAAAGGGLNKAAAEEARRVLGFSDG